MTIQKALPGFIDAALANGEHVQAARMAAEWGYTVFSIIVREMRARSYSDAEIRAARLAFHATRAMVQQRSNEEV